MMKRRGLCTTRTIVGALVLTMGAITTSTIAQEVGPVVGSDSFKINQGPIQTDLNCPETVVDEDGLVHMTQNDNIFVDGETTVACGIAKLGQTTENGWARCFDLVAEGINGDLRVDVVYFGVQQATIEDIVVDVNLYISNVGCDLIPGEPPDQPPNPQATLVATGSRLVGPADELGSLKPVFFDGVIIPAGSTLIIEIANQADGTVEPFFAFRPRSNALGECAPSYLRTASCGIPGWIGTAAIGFPDSQIVIKCIGQEIIPDVPEGDTCDDCIPVGEGVIFGSTLDNTAEDNITSCGLDPFITEWYCYTASCDGVAIVDTCGDGTDYDTHLSAFDSCGGNEIACNDDACPGFKSEINFPVVAGGTYYIRVSGFGGDSGNFEMNISCQEPGEGDTCDTCIPIGDGVINGDNTGSTPEADPTSCSFGGPNATIADWYCYTAPCDGIATATTCNDQPPNPLDTVLAVFDSCGGNELACNDDDCGLRSTISWPAVAGTTYYLRVAGWDGNTGPYTLDVSCGDAPPKGEGDTCEECIPVGEGHFSGTTNDNNAGPDLCGLLGDVITEWYCYTASCDGLATVNTCGSGFDTTLGILASCGSDPICNDDFCGLQSQVVFPVVAGETYFIRIAGFGGQSGNYELDISCSDGGPGDENVCNDSGDTLLSQSTSLKIVAPTGIACGGGGTTTENYYARSYTMDSDLGITCVGFGVETNTGNVAAHPADINVYLDTNGGAPDDPPGDLQLLGSASIGITPSSPFTIVYGNYDPPINVAAGDVIVVEFHVSDGSGITGIWPGANLLGQSGPGYLKADACELFEYIDYADIGFPDNALVNTIEGYGGGASPPCPWDLDGDNVISTADLLILFSQWGLAGGTADFDKSGDVGTSDLLILFANWGPCP
ncbi:MAG: hypothetical protein IH984_17005 [Planctomycetes bacterium]|nr:hypothetical protein [Planctomycetota bacterium]